MESGKVKEIKKAIQDHSIEKLKYQDGIKIKEISFAEILTLINELESENEILRNAKVVYETVDYCYEDLKKAEKRIAELKKEKTEQLKQFAKGLKDKAIRRQEFIGELAIDDIEYVKTQDIDETLKECIK